MVKNNAYEKLKNEEFTQRNKIRTITCLSFLKDGKCAYGKGCIFAHKQEELRKSICLFGKYCTNKKCGFDHSENAVLPEMPKIEEEKKEKSSVKINNIKIKKEYNNTININISLNNVNMGEREIIYEPHPDNRNEIKKYCDIMERELDKYKFNSN